MEIKIRTRSRLMQVLALFLFLFLVYAYAQLGWHLPQGIRQAAERDRGSILTLSGTVLAKTVDDQRVYPQGPLAGQLVGMVNADGGLEGLEHVYDERLAHGQNVTLTIDPTVQAAAEAVLGREVKDKQGDYGAVVALEVKTGRVLAAASYPPFNPASWRSFSAADRRNRPFLDTFEPGSVIKGLVVAAALNDGTTTPNTSYDTPMTRRVGQRWGSTIHDAVPHAPRLTTADILRYSSNVGMSHIAEGFSYQRLRGYLLDYGFGKSVELPAVNAQSGQLQPLARWNDLVRATNAFGQGMSVTLLQLAAAYNTVANDGFYVPPQLVADEPQPPGHRVLKPEAARAVRTMLRNAVDNQIARAAGIKGYSLGGKTGTAQVVVDGRYSDTIYNSTFAGFFPAEQPRVTLVVMVHGARKEHHGSQVAAPIYRDIAAEVLSEWGLPPEEPAAAQ